MSNFFTNGYLVSLLENASKDLAHPEFQSAGTYLKKFRNMEETFFEEYHSQVDIGLAMTEVARSANSEPNLFTIHGCRHISDLIKSLDKFSKEVSNKSGSTPVSILEAYILLCAAHVHDTANIRERHNHPERCNEIIIKYKHLFVSSACQQIYDVARVHGGHHPDFGKDTFRSIDVDSLTPPRLLLLAAFIRLGDELSENADRVPQAVVEKHPISGISQLAHAYAKSFVSFEIRNETLGIVYNVYPSEHTLRASVGDKIISFYKFLEAKIDVIERETRYCSQYSRPALNIGEINVTIRKYKGDNPSGVEASAKFSLQLNHGYPEMQNSLCERSKELSEKKFQTLEDCFQTSHPADRVMEAPMDNHAKQSGLLSKICSIFRLAKNISKKP